MKCHTVFNIILTAGLISQLGIKIIIASAFSSFPDLGLSLVNFSYSRQKEYEADEIGVRILNEANLDASGLANFSILSYNMPGIQMSSAYIYQRTLLAKIELPE